METSMSTEESFSFWKSALLVIFFFTVTPLTLGTSMFALFSLSKTEKDNSPTSLQIPRSGFKVYASLPASSPSVSGEVGASDARGEIIRQYLAAYASPLEPYAGLIVERADQYNLDFRLTTAIAGQESSFCKKYPESTFNCWGWGIHSEGTLGFSSFEEGIDTVSRGLREEYLDKGYATIEQIMAKYTPLSNGSWALGVSKFMDEMQ